MTLVTTESLSKHNCFERAAKISISYKIIQAFKLDSIVMSGGPFGSYWTAGTDLDCPGRYHWCNLDLHVKTKELPWDAGHPKKSAGDCMQVKIGKNSNLTYSTAACDQAKFFICEVRFLCIMKIRHIYFSNLTIRWGKGAVHLEQWWTNATQLKTPLMVSDK